MSQRTGSRKLLAPPVITIVSRSSMGATVNRFGLGQPATGTSPWSDAANSLLAFPFFLESMTTIYKAFWVNGSAAGGNSQVAIYDEDFIKVGECPSTLGSGNSVPQAVSMTGTVALQAGQYYCAMAHDATTTNQIWRFAPSIAGWGLQPMGCWKHGAITLGSLPATAVPADISNQIFPLHGLITRSNFDL